MGKKLKIRKVPMITPSGNKLDSFEEIVVCPKNVSNVNVNKSCARCKKGIVNTKHVICSYKRRIGD